MTGKVMYMGRRNFQVFVDGKRYAVKPRDVMELPLKDCLYLIDQYGFKAFGEETAAAIMKHTDIGDRYSKLQNMLSGKRCFIIGRGESLKGFDFDRLKKEFTIALNGAFLAFPAKALLFLDKEVVRKYKDDIKDFNGYIFCRESTHYHRMDLRDNIYPFPIHDQKIQQRVEYGLYNGALSGIAAINLAMALEAEKIYLLGYDMNPKKGKTYFDTQEENSNYTKQDWVKVRVKMFSAYHSFADRIIDCTPNNNLGFEYQDINTVLGGRK
jgi:hypothetical protein